MYILRLDDASQYMDIQKWTKLEKLLDKYHVKPLVALVPDCSDKDLIFKNDFDFEDTVARWLSKGWRIAMHGYSHALHNSSSGGLNPINKYSEFVGVDLEKQKDMISKGLKVFSDFGILTNVFVAPAHGFDENTLLALKCVSDIRFISDTIACDIYSDGCFTFVPQQCGSVRHLPFKITTFCYHPNNMKDSDYVRLERFLEKESKRFIEFPKTISSRRISLFDKLIRKLYFCVRKFK